jgi:hypothetical protein
VTASLTGARGRQRAGEWIVMRLDDPRINEPPDDAAAVGEGGAAVAPRSALRLCMAVLYG